jgi:hypothetical protein
VAEGSPRYYESWLAAFEALLEARGLVAHEELEARAREFKELQRDPVF